MTPVIIRDLAQRAQELPQEQLVKAQTLGASSWQLILRVILPQVTPRLFDALRLNLCSAWLFLIAAEAIASTEGWARLAAGQLEGLRIRRGDGGHRQEDRAEVEKTSGMLIV